jgi:hypothetical protein
MPEITEMQRRNAVPALPRDNLKLKFPFYYEYLATCLPQHLENYVRGYAVSRGDCRQRLDAIYRNNERLQRIKAEEKKDD